MLWSVVAALLKEAIEKIDERDDNRRNILPLFSSCKKQKHKYLMYAQWKVEPKNSLGKILRSIVLCWMQIMLFSLCCEQATCTKQLSYFIFTGHLVVACYVLVLAFGYVILKLNKERENNENCHDTEIHQIKWYGAAC